MIVEFKSSNGAAIELTRFATTTQRASKADEMLNRRLVESMTGDACVEAPIDRGDVAFVGIQAPGRLGQLCTCVRWSALPAYWRAIYGENVTTLPNRFERAEEIR